MDVRVGLWRKLSAQELMLLNCGVGEDSWESLGLQGDPTSPFWKKSVLGVHWKDWCWSWNSNTLATSCEEVTHWKRLWCWEGLGAGGEGDERGWDGWMASLTRWRWVWVNSVSWWWTGRPGMLQFTGCKESDTTDWLTWTESFVSCFIFYYTLPFRGLSFHLSYSFLCFAKTFKFNQVSLVYFCFYFHYSRRWVIENLALIYVIECSAYVFLLVL